MSDWLHGTCPRNAECAFYQTVARSPLMRVKYATMHPYCKGGKHESCMRWWVMERGEPVASDLLPDGGHDVFENECILSRQIDTPGKILVVDDLPMFRQSLVVLAGNACAHKCSIIATDCAENALEILKADPAGWSLLATDFHMGGMSGYELILHMRSHPGLSSVPAIVFSSEQDKSLKDRCTAMPMVRWLDKRPDQRLFDEAWNELVKGRKA